MCPNCTADLVWRKVHLRRYPQIPNFQLLPGRMSHLPDNHRSMLHLGTRRPWGKDRWTYLGYSDEMTRGDRRVMYTNPKWPWIMGVHV